MSYSLFKFFYQDDLDGFKEALAGAVAANGLFAIPRRGNHAASGGLTVKDVNRVDEYGRTVLHLASSQNKIEFVRALLDINGIDVMAIDGESGWTALHRALYAGNVAIAQLLMEFQKDCIRVKDREGNSPFDVLNSTIEGTNPLPLNIVTGGSELFTFGSNANHTLGFNDSDDRANPERVLLDRTQNVPELPAMERFANIRIRDVQMSKLHTAVLTTDPVNNLMICGFGNNGRLGFSGGNTQFTFKTLETFGQVQVTAVAVSQDHTLAVTADGAVYSWGSNKYGQLGYTLDVKKPQDEPVQSSPRKIVAGIKRDHMIGVAASRIHSVTFSDSELFMWGKNAGQLGFPAGDGQPIEMTPRKVSSLPAPVKMASATENATICLLENNDVIVYINGGYFKVFFPLDRFTDQFSVFRPRSMFTKNVITKIVAGGTTVLALSSGGDIWSFQLDGKAVANAKPSSLSKTIRPQNVWRLRRKHLAVRDLDVGQDGSVIVCTKAGTVWRKVRRTKAKTSHGKVSEFKFSRIPHLTRVVAVRSNKFDSYAAIRSDLESPEIEIDHEELRDDIERMIPFADVYDQTESDSVSVSSEDSAVSEATQRLPQTFLPMLEFLRDENLRDQLEPRLEDLDLAAYGGSYDLMLYSSDDEFMGIPVHRVIIASRSKLIADIISGAAEIPDIEYREDENGRSLVFKKCGLLALLIFIYFAYTDYILPVWDGFGSKSKVDKRFLNAKDELIALASTLRLKSLSSAVYFQQRPTQSLAIDLREAVADPRFQEWTDLTVQLEDGEARCYSVIMSARSEFFETLMSARWSAVPAAPTPSSDYYSVSSYAPATSSEEEDVDKTVDMKHVRSAVFKVVLDFIYGVEDESLFAEVQTESLAEFLEFVLEVLSVANELLITKLTQICQSILRSYVNVRNAAPLLAEADFYSAQGLKDSLLQYIALNLEGMLENGLLSSLEAPLLQDLEKTVRQKQLEKLPVSKSGILLQLLEERNPALGEARQKEKDRLVQTFESSSLPSSYGGSLPQSFSSSFTKSGIAAEFRDHGSSHNQKSTQRRGSREQSGSAVPQSPVMTATIVQSNDFIFDMDDELSSTPSTPATAADWKVVKGKTKSGNTPSTSYTAPSSFDEHMRPSSFRDTSGFGSYRRESFAASITPTDSHLAKPSSLSNSSPMARPSEFNRATESPASSSSWKPKPVSGISLALQNRKTSATGLGSEQLPSTPHKSQENFPATPGSSSAVALSSPVTASATTSTATYISPVVKPAVSQKNRKKQRAQEVVSSPPSSSKSSSPWSTPAKFTPRSGSVGSFPSPQLFPMGPQTSFATTAATNASQLGKKAVAGVAGVAVSSSAGSSPATVVTATATTTAATVAVTATTATTATTASTFTAATPSSSSKNYARKVSSSSTPTRISKSLFPELNPQTLEPTDAVPAELQLSLAELIEQQRIEQDIIAANSRQKKSIEQLQEEEEFASWWAAESERVQAELQKQEAGAKNEGSAAAGAAGAKKKGGRGGAQQQRGGRGAGVNSSRPRGRGDGFRKGKHHGDGGPHQSQEQPKVSS
ncbi:hypothetical protein BZA70DRAFT_6240 [Myxozyma melibiosi]|uniref:BTB domain-containing protein n=1 Tax=Myxozyma melibiosi TaxID=54550 RepID=A0ABR1FBG0_9ASCO